MADGKMPDFIKKKIDAKSGSASGSDSESESASESSDSASESPAPAKGNPFMKWAKKKAGG